MSLLRRMSGQEQPRKPGQPETPAPAQTPPPPPAPGGAGTLPWEQATATAAPPAPVAGAPAATAEPPRVTSVDEVTRQRMSDLRDWIVDRLIPVLDQGTLSRTPEMEASILQRIQDLYRQSGTTLTSDDQKVLFQQVQDEMLGFGPLEALLRDHTISEIMVNGPKMVFIEQKGRIRESGIEFRDNDHVLRIIDRIIRPLGRTVDRKRPYVDARLPDGSRVNAVIPPVAIDGPSITIRKFSRDKLGVADLVRFGSVTPAMAEFLKACVVTKLNIVVSGGTGSGKTTLLNILSTFIPEEDRIVTIEDSAELQLQQRHVVRLEAKPAEVDGSGRVSIRDLVMNSLRMRPERIVIGECRGGEALDMLQAMNTGHDGSLTTAHANTPRDCLARLETMSLMAGMDLPLKVIREQIASAVDLIVQQARLRDGSRKVTAISEVQGMEGDTIVMQDIFRFEEQGVDEDGKVVGQFRPLGIRPRFTPRLEAAGFQLPPEIFTPTSGPRRF